MLLHLESRSYALGFWASHAQEHGEGLGSGRLHSHRPHSQEAEYEEGGPMVTN